MEIKMYLKEWGGVVLADLLDAREQSDSPLTAEFYGRFYAALKSKGPSDAKWVANKQKLGDQIAAEFFEPWQRQFGRRPRILATGAGEAWAEGQWLAAGYSTTLQDGTDELFEAIRLRHPTVLFEIGNMHNFVPSEDYDIITMLANDYVLDSVELPDFLSRLAQKLVRGGKIIIYCPNTLSYRRVVIEAVRRLTGYHRRNRWVFWGWWRTKASFQRAATTCGLRLTHSVVSGCQGPIAKLLPMALRNESGMFELTKPL